MRKVACLAVFMALMMLVPVQAGGDVSIQQTETEEEDPRQPSKEAKARTAGKFRGGVFQPGADFRF